MILVDTFFAAFAVCLACIYVVDAASLRATADQETVDDHAKRSLQDHVQWPPPYLPAYKELFPDANFAKCSAFLERRGIYDPVDGTRCHKRTLIGNYTCLVGLQTCTSTQVPNTDTHPTKICKCDINTRELTCGDPWDPCGENEVVPPAVVNSVQQVTARPVFDPPAYWGKYRQAFPESNFQPCAFLEKRGITDPQGGERCHKRHSDYTCVFGTQTCDSDLVPTRVHPAKTCKCDVTSGTLTVCQDWAPCVEIGSGPIPVEEIPAEEIPAEEIPAEEIPVEVLPVEVLPVEEIPVEEIPVEEIPVEEIPTCGSFTSCRDCLAHGCGWGVGSCLPDCSMLADASCYQGDAETMCSSMEAAELDASTCRAANADCETCTNTMKPSSQSPCLWLDFGTGTPACASYCGMMGCGLTNGGCPTTTEAMPLPDEPMPDEAMPAPDEPMLDEAMPVPDEPMPDEAMPAPDEPIADEAIIVDEGIPVTGDEATNGTVIDEPIPQEPQVEQFVEPIAIAIDGRPFTDYEGTMKIAEAVENRLQPTLWSTSSVTEGSRSVLLTEDRRLALAEEWKRRAVGEHSSIASFAAFAIALMTNQAPPDLVEASLIAAMDELRHAQVSFEMASLLSQSTIEPSSLPPSQHDFQENLTTLASGVAKEGCVDETLSALVLAASVDQIRQDDDAADPTMQLLAEKTTQIAKEEGNHSVLAWRTIHWVCSMTTEDACAVVLENWLQPSQLESSGEARLGSESSINAWRFIYKQLVPLVTKSETLDSSDETHFTEGTLVAALANDVVDGVRAAIAMMNPEDAETPGPTAMNCTFGEGEKSGMVGSSPVLFGASAVHESI